MFFLKWILYLIIAYIIFIFLKIIIKTIRNVRGHYKVKDLIKEIESWPNDIIDQSILDHYTQYLLGPNGKKIAFGPVLNSDSINFKGGMDSENNDKEKWNVRNWKDIEMEDNKINELFNDLQKKLDPILDSISLTSIIECHDMIDEAINDKLESRVKEILVEKANKDGVIVGVFENEKIYPEVYNKLKLLNSQEVFFSMENDLKKEIEVISKRIEKEELSDYSKFFDDIKDKIEKDLGNPEILSSLTKGIEQGFADFKNLCKGENIYTFGLYTSSEFNNFSIVGNTTEGMNRKINEFKNSDDWKEYNYTDRQIQSMAKWGFGDWEYSFKIENTDLDKAGELVGSITNYFWSGCKESNEINDLDYFESKHDEFYENYSVEYNDKILQLLKKAVDQHLMVNPEIFFYYQNYDPTREKMMYDIRFFNSKEKADKFEAEFFEDK